MTFKQEWYLITSTYPNANMYQMGAWRIAFELEPWANEPGGQAETLVLMNDYISANSKTLEDIYEAACDAYYVMTGDPSLRGA